MHPRENEDDGLRSVALQNAQAILAARRRSEEELIAAKEALEGKTHELLESLAMMRATLEATTDGILVTDDSLRITGSNRRYAEMWGVPPELITRGDHASVLEEISRRFSDPKAFAARVGEIYSTSPEESFDLLHLADGRTFERCSRLQIVEGRKAGRVWSFRDISERRRAEEALRDETRVLELLNKTT